MALEEGYDRPSWWHNGRYRAETYSEQEVQPIFTMKDTWEVCTCEGADAILPGYGQVDIETGEELQEYIWCPLGGGNPDNFSRQYRYDWRPGRELTEDQATRWALHHISAEAHDLFNGPAKEATVSVHLPAAHRIELDGVDISQWVTGNLDIELSDWQRRFFSNAVAPDRSITISYSEDDLGYGGMLRARRNGRVVSLAVSAQAMEDERARDDAVRRLCQHFDAFPDGGGQQGSGADREGQAGS